MRTFSKTYFWLFLSIYTFSADAQKFSLDDTQWWRGQVVIDEDTMTSLFQYSTETNSFRIKDTEGGIKMYSPKKITAFGFFDPNWRQQRNFETLLYSKKVGGYESPMFFEVISRGKKVSLLMRENMTYSPWINIQTMSKPYAEFYLQTDDETIHHYRGTERKLLEVMKDRKEDVEAFIKTNNLNTDSLPDLLRILNYYNRI